MTLKYLLYSILSPFVKPRMVWGYKIPGGHFLKTVRIGSSTFIDHKKNLVLGENVYVGHYNFIEASNHIEIQEGCQITNFVNITTHSSHQSIRLYGKHYTKFKDHKAYIKGKVQIGSYTFIGPHSVIMPGTSLGKGCLVAAYSYVQGDFPDFSIIKGNPAKVVGNTRDMDERILVKHPELESYYREWQD